MKNNTIQAIMDRRSIYPAQFTGGDIPQGDLEKIMKTAQWAPTHKMTQPWRFKVLQGDAKNELGRFISTAYDRYKGKENSFKSKKMRGKFEDSSAVILIFMQRDPRESLPEWEEQASTAMAVQNIWLTVSSMGYGGYWSSPKKFAEMRDFDRLDIGEGERFLGFFYLGTHNGEEPEAPERKPVSEYVQWLK